MSELQEPAYLICSQRIQLESDVSVSTSAQRGPEALAHIPIIFLSPFPLSLPPSLPPSSLPSLFPSINFYEVFTNMCPISQEVVGYMQ